MNTETSRCPKCDGEMVRGFSIDQSYGHVALSTWFEGAPKSSFWSDLKLRGVNAIPIATFRCSACGFLESYARLEFAAE